MSLSNSNNSNQNLDNSKKIFYKLKLILIGDSGVGKTSLLSRYMDETFTANKPCTLTADYRIKSIKIDPLTTAEITIWDTCGQEKYRAMTKQYFKDAHGIILMFDVCDKRSFSDLDIWLDEIKKNTPKDDVSIVLCGNKIDLNFRNITFEEAKNFAQKNGLLYSETSAKEGNNIEVAFENVTKDIIQKMGKKNKLVNEYKEKVYLNEKVVKKERKREKDVKCC